MDDKQKDNHLLKQIEKGSNKAFDQFYETYISFVLHIAIGMLHDRKEAEDVCHDIFLDIYLKPKQYKAAKGSVKAWLAVKTRNRCIDHLRKRKPVLINKLENLETRHAAKAELHVLAHLEKEIVLEALAHLPEKQREAIYGMYFEGKTQREMAKRLNRPLGTIKSSIRYGLENLRKQKNLLDWTKADGGSER